MSTALRPGVWAGAKLKSSMAPGLGIKFTLAAILFFDLVAVSVVLAALGGA